MLVVAAALLAASAGAPPGPGIIMYPPLPQPCEPLAVPGGLVAAAVESELRRVAWAGRCVTMPRPTPASSVSAPKSTHKRLLRMEPPPVDRPGRPGPLPEDCWSRYGARPPPARPGAVR